MSTDEDYALSASEAAAEGGEHAAPEDDGLGLYLLARGWLLDAFATLSLHASLSRSFFLLLHLLGLLQLLLIPLSPSLFWRAPGTAGNAVAGFHPFLTAVALLPWADPSGALQPYSPLSLFVAAAAYSGCTLALFCRVLWAAARGGRAGRLELQALRLLLQLALTAAPVPLLGNLLSPLSCTTVWGGGLPCYSPPHLAALAIGLLLACALLALLVGGALMLKHPALDLKGNPCLQAHGRAQAAQLLVRAVLATVFVLGPNATPWLHALVSVLGGVALLALQAHFLDYYDQSINRALCAMHAVFLAAGVACLLCVGLYSGGGGSPASVSGAALVWAFLTPLAAQGGWSLAVARWGWVAGSKDLSTAYIVELRERHLLGEGRVVGKGLLGGGGGEGGEAEGGEEAGGQGGLQQHLPTGQTAVGGEG